VTARPQRPHRWTGLPAAVFGLAVAVVAAVLTLGFGLAAVAMRGPVLFQPVADQNGTFVAAGTGPFLQKYPAGVGDDGRAVPRIRAGADDFDRSFAWGSPAGGVVVQNLSGKPICEVTVAIADDATFPTDAGRYQTPGGWRLTVGDDAKQVTFQAVQRPDACVAVGGWFWVRAPRTSDPAGPTLVGRLAFADAGADAVVVASLEPGPQGAGTPAPSASPTPGPSGTPSPSGSAPAATSGTPSSSGSTSGSTSKSPPGKPATTPRHTPTSSRTSSRPGHPITVSPADKHTPLG
jgi:hypothetical protein